MAMLQLVLDLFGVAPAAPAFESKTPPAPEGQAPTAPQLIANEPAVALGDALMPAHFAHPRANRAIDFAHARVHYEFQRGQRRTIGFSVGPDGLAVRAPRWTPLHEVEAALREKERWIVAKLGEARERHARIESNRDVIRQDEYGNFMVVLLNGTIAVDRLQPWGEQLRLAETRPGDILGEMSLLDSGIRFSACTTLTDCEIAVLSAEAMDDMMTKDPQLAASLIALLARRLSLRLRVVSARLSDNQK